MSFCFSAIMDMIKNIALDTIQIYQVIIWKICTRKQCCGSGMFTRILAPGSKFFQSGSKFFQSGSRIRIKEFKYFNPKKWFLSSRKYDPGCSSWIPDPDADFLPIPDPGSRGQKGIGSRIPDPDPQHCCRYVTEVKL